MWGVPSGAEHGQRVMARGPDKQPIKMRAESAVFVRQPFIFLLLPWYRGPELLSKLFVILVTIFTHLQLAL